MMAVKTTHGLATQKTITRIQPKPSDNDRQVGDDASNKSLASRENLQDTETR
jgi:hypothetical protein